MEVLPTRSASSRSGCCPGAGLGARRRSLHCGVCVCVGGGGLRWVGGCSWLRVVGQFNCAHCRSCEVATAARARLR